MEELLLPKPHLSWSQYSCWVSNPTRYRKEYFECGKKLDTKYLRFGKGIAGMIEKNEHLKILPDLVVYDMPEFEIKTDVEGVPILSYIDSYNSIDNVYREFKTGKVPWTKAKVLKHGQLVFYAVALKHGIGEAPEECWLDWIQTKEVTSDDFDDFWRENEKKVHITGKIMSFHRPFHEIEIKRMEKSIVKVAHEISNAYKSFLMEI